jgi:hypothetical protein
MHKLNIALNSNPHLATLIRHFKFEVPAQSHWPDIVSEEMAMLLPRLDHLQSMEIKGLLWDARIPKTVKTALFNCISCVNGSLSLASCFFVSVASLLIVVSHTTNVKAFDLRDLLLVRWDVPLNDVLPPNACQTFDHISPATLHINTSLLLLVLMKLGPEMTTAFDITKVKDLDVHANCLFPLGWLKLPDVEHMRIESFCEQQDDLPIEEKAGHHRTCVAHVFPLYRLFNLYVKILSTSPSHPRSKP